MVMLTDVLQNGILQAPKPRTKRSLICANLATIREPKRFVRMRRVDPGCRGSTRAVQVLSWTGQSVWAFACASGSLAGGGRPSAMPSKTLRFPIPKPAKYSHAPCPSCACKIDQTWDVYLVELDLRGEITPHKLGVPKSQAEKMLHYTPGHNARCVILWPHALTLFPDGMPVEQEAESNG